MQGLTRNLDKNFMLAAAHVWLMFNCFTLLGLVILYNVAPNWLNTDNLDNILLRDPMVFYGAVGLVLAMGPIHYTLFYFQVGEPLLFLAGNQLSYVSPVSQMFIVQS